MPSKQALNRYAVPLPVQSSAQPLLQGKACGKCARTWQETNGAQPAHTNGAADPESGRPSKRARTPPRVHAPRAHPTPTLDTCGSSPDVGAAAARPAKRRVIIDDSEDDATPQAAPAVEAGAPRVWARAKYTCQEHRHRCCWTQFDWVHGMYGLRMHAWPVKILD